MAKWLQQDYPSAGSSLLEGLDEMFTINKLGLPKTLCRSLGSTNVIESPNSGSRTRRVKNWQDHGMVEPMDSCFSFGYGAAIQAYYGLSTVMDAGSEASRVG